MFKLYNNTSNNNMHSLSDRYNCIFKSRILDNNKWHDYIFPPGIHITIVLKHIITVELFGKLHRKTKIMKLRYKLKIIHK